MVAGNALSVLDLSRATACECLHRRAGRKEVAVEEDVEEKREEVRVDCPYCSLGDNSPVLLFSQSNSHDMSVSFYNGGADDRRAWSSFRQVEGFQLEELQVLKQCDAFPADFEEADSAEL